MIKTKFNLTEGPVFSRLFFFTVPVIASGLLQVAYNMADNIVVGNFSGDDLALAAVGSTATLTTLIVNFLIGFATGSGAIIAQNYGAKDEKNLRASIHTAATIAIIGGLLLATIAFVLAEPVLILMGTKGELMSRAVLYFRIICIGVPASTVYNFGAAILRAVGDSQKPLYILGISGLINVALNLVFVICLDMTVDGVALATIISQYLSATAVVFLLIWYKDKNCRLRFPEFGINRSIFLKILKIAIPASLQSSLFSISNVFIQSSANQLTVSELSARTISGNIDNLVYTSINSYSHTSMTFVAQNYGAKRFDRIKKCVVYTILQVSIIGISLGYTLLFFGRDLVGMFIDNGAANREEVIEYAIGVMKIILTTYFMCGIMEALSGILRGLGNSLYPMIIGLTGVCGLRMVWIFAFFRMDAFHSLSGLYLCYPITWVFCITALLIVMIIEWRKKINSHLNENNMTIIK